MIIRRFYILLVFLFLISPIISCQQSKDSKIVDSNADMSEARQIAERLVKSCDVIIVGNITNIYDGTHRDGGMSYDVEVGKVIYGKHSSGTLHFASRGWIGYAEYKKGEKVLLFLANYGQNPTELQIVVMDGHQVICYIRDNIVDGPFGNLSLYKYLELIKEVKKG